MLITINIRNRSSEIIHGILTYDFQGKELILQCDVFKTNNDIEVKNEKIHDFEGQQYGHSYNNIEISF